MATRLSIALFLIFFQASSAFQRIPSHNFPTKSSTSHFYEIPKKGEKRDIGRLIKNIIFPGIYTEYADTKSSIKTVKIDTGSSDLDQKIRSARATATDKGLVHPPPLPPPSPISFIPSFLPSYP